MIYALSVVVRGPYLVAFLFVGESLRLAGNTSKLLTIKTTR